MGKVSLRIDTRCQGISWGPGCWRADSQAGKQLGWRIGDHFAFFSAEERVNVLLSSCLCLYQGIGSHV